MIPGGDKPWPAAEDRATAQCGGGGLTANLEKEGGRRPSVLEEEEAVHPYLTQAAAAERIRDWQRRTARAEQARRVRGIRRARKLAARPLPLLRGTPEPAARLADGSLGGAQEPGPARERQPTGTRAA